MSLCFTMRSGLVITFLPRSTQGDNIRPWHTPFPIWNQSVVPCPVLTVASWRAYKFLKRQIGWYIITILHDRNVKDIPTQLDLYTTIKTQSLIPFPIPFPFSLKMMSFIYIMLYISRVRRICANPNFLLELYQVLLYF